MTKALKDLLERAAEWPEGVQEAAVEALRMIERNQIGVYKLTAEDKAALRRSAEDVRKGRFASEKK